MDNFGLARHARRWLWLTLLLGGVLLQAVWIVQAGPASQSAEEGRVVFDKYCAGCHTIGGGDMAGPDLAGVADRRSPEWLARWLAEPDKMIADGDPIALELLAQYNNIPMPNQHLSLTEIDALLVYLGADRASLPSSPAQPASPAVVGDAAAGRDLFTGSNRLDNGGIACIACHDLAALGVPGGGLLGPDLTGAVTRYGGAAGMKAVLGNIPFPSMVPIYRDRPLTPQEQSDLTAFLDQSATSEPPNLAGRHISLTILAVGMLDVLLVLLFVWHRRLPQHTRQALARRSKRQTP